MSHKPRIFRVFNGVALCVRAQLRHNNNTLSTRTAVLWRERQQQLSSPSAGTKPCSSAKSRLKTQKEGQEVPEITTDVRDSQEVEKKEHDEPEATPSSHQDEDKFNKCECLAWRV